MVFQPAPWSRDPAWLLPVLALSLGALMLTVILWPVAVLARRHYGARFSLEGQDASSHRAARVGALAALLVTAGWGGMLLLIFLALDKVGSSLDPLVMLLNLGGPVVLLAALAAVAWDAWRVWRRTSGWRAWFARGWSAVLVLSVLTVIWTSLVFHLFGLSANY
jgi:hypothetical protein